MALTLTGDGSITGLAAGGLPDLSVGTGDIADAAITAAKMSGAQSGSAPIYGARAWVNFDGTTNVGGFCTIRGSGNVSSVADGGTGIYTVNFTIAMADTNYVIATNNEYKAGFARGAYQYTTKTTSACQVICDTGSGQVDQSIVSFIVFG